MMVMLVFVLEALVVGALFGTLIARDAGYVLIAYDDMSLETSIWFALLVLVAAYFLFRLIAVFLSGFLRSRLGLQMWNNDRMLRKARTLSVKGVLLMAEGKWLQARKTLVSAAARAEIPLINYLFAARAAHELNDEKERDALLHLARETTPGSHFAVNLVQAQMLIERKDWEAGLATLQNLRSQSAGHPQVLKMLGTCYQQLEDWTAVIELIPQLRKHKVLGEEALGSLGIIAWQKRLIALGEALSEQKALSEGKLTDKSASKHLSAFWAKLPKGLSRNPELVGTYANLLAGNGLGIEAETLLAKSLAQSWDKQLVRCYGRVEGKDRHKQLTTAESWLKQHPNDADLLLSLGRICMMNGKWQQARDYFEASLRQDKSIDVYAELGRLCMALGKQARGREYMIQAMVLAGNIPDLPLPQEVT